MLALSSGMPQRFLISHDFGNHLSEISDILDLEHFKRTLANDVRIVSSLPSTHLRSRPVGEKRTPLHVSPEWIRSRYLKAD
ncbi:O-fucosyltransferase 20-like protein [Cinnamomum micranthum f. kanehirae]|uniref:O-fucosyltransferase 20-like protein n=1 Tax=Cinnamomum micranthum f. kanehirae TaxID=337451 RepID=A0A3S3MRE2_9MAGN|nr:O-fucosyltransferase 20-like protein [Cinnamomum micranthum f. kanehirae]